MCQVGGKEREKTLRPVKASVLVPLKGFPEPVRTAALEKTHPEHSGCRSVGGVRQSPTHSADTGGKGAGRNNLTCTLSSAPSPLLLVPLIGQTQLDSVSKGAQINRPRDWPHGREAVQRRLSMHLEWAKTKTLNTSAESVTLYM